MAGRWGWRAGTGCRHHRDRPSAGGRTGRPSPGGPGPFGRGAFPARRPDRAFAPPPEPTRTAPPPLPPTKKGAPPFAGRGRPSFMTRAGRGRPKGQAALRLGARCGDDAAGRPPSRPPLLRGGKHPALCRPGRAHPGWAPPFATALRLGRRRGGLARPLAAQVIQLAADQLLDVAQIGVFVRIAETRRRSPTLRRGRSARSGGHSPARSAARN